MGETLMPCYTRHAQPQAPPSRKTLGIGNERAESSHDVKPALFHQGRDGFPDRVARESRFLGEGLL